MSARHGQRQEVEPIPFSLHPEIPLDERRARLDVFIRQKMRDTSVPGLSIALVHDRKLAWAGGYGVANSITRRLVTQDTPFEAASIGKCVTAYAALKLTNEGRLDLNQPLSKYLDRQFIQDERYRDKITATTVLTHTSGLSNDLMESLHRVAFEPGSRFSYSGVGFMYLQKAIEELTHQPFDAFMPATIFAPLGMSSSSYLRSSSEPRMSRGHFHLAGFAAPMPFFPSTQPNAANLLCSTASDLARFACELMNPTLVNSELVRNMLSPHVHVAGDAWWGLGIGLYGENPKCFWHWGDNLDFEAYLTGCPAEKIGVVVMTNSSRGLLVAREVAAKALSGN